MAVQGVWHQRGHPEVRVTGIQASEKFKARAHESFASSTCRKTWRNLRSVDGQAQGARVNALWLLIHFPLGNSAIRVVSPPAQSQEIKKIQKIYRNAQELASSGDWVLSGVNSWSAPTWKMHWQSYWWTDRSYLFLSIFISVSLSLSVHAHTQTHTSSSGCAQWGVRWKRGYEGSWGQGVCSSPQRC